MKGRKLDFDSLSFSAFELVDLYYLSFFSSNNCNDNDSQSQQLPPSKKMRLMNAANTSVNGNSSIQKECYACPHVNDLDDVMNYRSSSGSDNFSSNGNECHDRLVSSSSLPSTSASASPRHHMSLLEQDGEYRPSDDSTYTSDTDTKSTKINDENENDQRKLKRLDRKESIAHSKILANNSNSNCIHRNYHEIVSDSNQEDGNEHGRTNVIESNTNQSKNDDNQSNDIDSSKEEYKSSFKYSQSRQQHQDHGNNHCEYHLPKSSQSLTSFELLDPKLCPKDESPDSYLHRLFDVIGSNGSIITVRPTLEVSSLNPTNQSPSKPFIPPITEEEQSAYTTEIVTAVRENDLPTVQSYHAQGHSLSCCNRFGESLLHMACRRGFASMVTYLLESAHVSVRITDDCGRTPLHDALWNQECQYSIVDLLVRTDPILLLTCDKRGHTPFAYARREHWGNWRQFLWDRREHMKNAIKEEEMDLFRVVL